MIIVSLVMLHFTQSSPIGFGVFFCTANMCGGSIASMLPAVTLQVFGLKRGNGVYSCMYSVYAVSAQTSTVLVKLMQSKVGFNGMLDFCVVFSFLAAIIS